MSRPLAEAQIAAGVTARVPRLSERQVVGGPVDERTALDRLEEPAELALLLPHPLVRAAHDVDDLIVRAADMRAVQVEGRLELAVRPVRRECSQGGHRGVNALAAVIPVMVAGLAVLALVALLHAILIHEGDGQDLDVPPEPVPVLVIRQDALQQSLHHVVRHRLAGMVPGRHQDPVRHLAVQPAHMQALDAPAVLAFAQLLHREVRTALVPGQEFLEVLLLVRNPEAETHLFRRRGTYT